MFSVRKYSHNVRATYPVSVEYERWHRTDALSAGGLRAPADVHLQEHGPGELRRQLLEERRDPLARRTPTQHNQLFTPTMT